MPLLHAVPGMVILGPFSCVRSGTRPPTGRPRHLCQLTPIKDRDRVRCSLASASEPAPSFDAGAPPAVGATPRNLHARVSAAHLCAQRRVRADAILASKGLLQAVTHPVGALQGREHHPPRRGIEKCLLPILSCGIPGKVCPHTVSCRDGSRSLTALGETTPRHRDSCWAPSDRRT